MLLLDLTKRWEEKAAWGLFQHHMWRCWELCSLPPGAVPQARHTGTPALKERVQHYHFLSPVCFRISCGSWLKKMEVLEEKKRKNSIAVWSLGNPFGKFGENNRMVCFHCWKLYMRDNYEEHIVKFKKRKILLEAVAKWTPITFFLSLKSGFAAWLNGSKQWTSIFAVLKAKHYYLIGS